MKSEATVLALPFNVERTSAKPSAIAKEIHAALTIYNSELEGYRKTMAEGGHGINISCSICFEEFKVPKMLPCGHTFCCECVSKMVDSFSSLQCPICRRDITLPESGKVEDFPTNFALMDLIPDHEATKQEFDPELDSSKHYFPVKLCSESPESLAASCTTVKKDPTLTPGPGTTVFIRNLDKSIDNKALYNLFSTYGNILSCEVATDQYGEKYGYGYVHFETQEAAQKAIQMVNGMWLNGLKVYVGKMVSHLLPNISTHADNARRYTNIYIKNFGTEMEEEELRAICEVYGKILSLKIMTDVDGYSRGFAFVSFESYNSAMQCADDLNGKVYKGRQLYAGRAQTRSERSKELRARFEELRNRRSQGMNLYIKNPDPDTDDERLHKEFSRFGYITSAKREIIAQQAVHVAGNLPLTAEMLVLAQLREQKQMLGERIFPIIKQSHEAQAGKITGMLLEMDNAELLYMLKSPESLYAKVQEALAVLAAHQQKK